MFLKATLTTLSILLYVLPLGAQQDTLPEEWIISGSGWSSWIGTYPYCDDYCRLDGKVYDLKQRQFVADSTAHCNGQRLDCMRWWEDSYDRNFRWFIHAEDSLHFLTRHHCGLNRIDTFAIPRWTGFCIAEPGIYLGNGDSLWLFDRYSGKLIIRAAAPPDEARTENLYAWGANVVVGKKWLFLLKEQRYTNFMPFKPEDGLCFNPINLHISNNLCSSAIGSNYYVAVPGYSIRLPFIPGQANQISGLGNILSYEPPLVWLYTAKAVVSINIQTDSITYFEGTTGEPLRQDLKGPFIAFKNRQYLNEKLSIFDKNIGKFGYLNPIPHRGWYTYDKQMYYPIKIEGFAANSQYIVLDYHTFWKVMPFRLDTNFNDLKEKKAQEDYERFVKNADETFPPMMDIYSQYDRYVALKKRYGDHGNPFILDYIHGLKKAITDPDWLFCCCDSLNTWEIAKACNTGRFDSLTACEIMENIFDNWYGSGNMGASLWFTQHAAQRRCVINNTNDIKQYLLTIKHRLDSIEQSNLPADEKAYQTARVWYHYFMHRPDFGTSHSTQNEYSAFEYLKRFIKVYPNSRYTSEAVYDTMVYIDYEDPGIEDWRPTANFQTAYSQFHQFLKDYPNSDKTPNVLTRIARLVYKGVLDTFNCPILQKHGDSILYHIGEKYPSFANSSKLYDQYFIQLKARAWQNTWQLHFSFDKPAHLLQDTIRLQVTLLNISDKPQDLDTLFLNHWTKRLQVLMQTQTNGCERQGSSFRLFPVNKDLPKPATMLPGSSVVCPFYVNKIAEREVWNDFIRLSRGISYLCSLQLNHSVPWMEMSSDKKQTLSIE